MKNFDYIEHVINDQVSERTKQRFIARLFNDPDLRKQYQQYVQISEYIQEQEDIIRKVNQNFPGYTFRINEAANLHDLQDNHGDICRMGEESRIIKSVIKTNRSPKPGEKNGWFRAAAVMSLCLLVMASWLISGKDTFRFCDVIVLVS
jgi:uncharacterized protein YozE (UPF0346 family)